MVLPGFTGVRLLDTSTGRLVWGDGRVLIRPRDGGYPMALAPGKDPAAGSVVPDGPILSFRVLGVIPFDAYAPLVEIAERRGYRLGDALEPQVGERLFFLDYDWRQGIEPAVRRLHDLLERIRVARGQDVLRVSLVAQSNAARIARYYARYGPATLEEAESGGTGPPASIRVERIVFVGTAHGGAIRVLRMMLRGRTYVPVVGKHFLPETMFTWPAIYEALPHHRDDLFVDPDGRPVEADLYDPATWKTYGWAMYDPEVRRRIDTLGQDGPFGTQEDRERFLATQLARAKRLHHLLEQDGVDGVETRYVSVQSRGRETPARAVLEPRDGGWRTLFSEDRWVRRRPRLLEATTADGDGHATLASQEHLSESERSLLEGRTIRVRGTHFKMITLEDNLQRIFDLLEQAVPAADRTPGRPLNDHETAGSSALPAGKG